MPKKSEKLKSFLVSFVVLLCVLASLEVVVRLAARYSSKLNFNLLSRELAESFYFYYHLDAPEEEHTQGHDALLGWRPQYIRGTKIPYLMPENINQRTLASTKKKIAVVGDSFIFGWGVNEDETLSHYLQEKLGNEYEVLNFGVNAWGLDQMAIATAEVIPTHKPDLVVIAYIADDLVRSCYGFRFNGAKPLFKRTENGLNYTYPTPTPYENQAIHRGKRQRMIDTAVTQLSRSALVRMFFEVALLPKQNGCINNLNPDIAQWTIDRTKDQFPVVFAHLSGHINSSYQEKMSQLGNHFSLVPEIDGAAKTLGLTPERFSDGHPKASLNQTYAEILTPKLRTYLRN